MRATAVDLVCTGVLATTEAIEGDVGTSGCVQRTGEIEEDNIALESGLFQFEAPNTPITSAKVRQSEQRCRSTPRQPRHKSETRLTRSEVAKTMTQQPRRHERPPGTRGPLEWSTRQWTNLGVPGSNRIRAPRPTEEGVGPVTASHTAVMEIPGDRYRGRLPV